MKTRNLIMAFMALFSIWMTGCMPEDYVQEEHNHQNQNSKLFAMIETNADAVTRTVIDKDGNTAWVESDKLGVFGDKGACNRLFSYNQETSTDEKAEFTGTLSDNAQERVEWAYYPYEEDASLDADATFHFNVPSTFRYNGESYAPMVAHADERGLFIFKYMCGILRITLGNMPKEAKQFVITSVGDDAPALSGAATVNNIHAKNAVYVIEPSESKSIIYDIENIDAGNEQKVSFTIPIPVGIYPKLEVSLKDNNGNAYFTRTLSNREIKRAVMVNMPILDALTGQNYILNEKTEEISDELAGEITISTENPSALIYSKVIEENDLPQVGTILLKGKITDEFPRGFLGRVTSVTQKNDGTHMVQTEAVSLSDAFKELYVNETMDLKPSTLTRGMGIKQDEDGYYCFTFDMEGTQEDGITLGAMSLKLGVKFSPFVDVSQDLMSFIVQTKTEFSEKIEFKGEFENEVIKKPIGKGILLPPFEALPLVITPVLQPYFIVKPSGEITLSSEVTFSTQSISAAEYKNKTWTKKSRSLKPTKTPWDINAQFKMSGELFIGASAAIEASLYNLDFVSMGIEAEAGCKLSGEVDLLQVLEATEKEELLSSCSLKHQMLLGGNFNIEAQILDFQAKAEFEFPSFVFVEKDLYTVPDVEKPRTQVTNGKEIQANVKSRIERELLTKATVVKNVLKDKNGELLQEGTEVAYAGEIGSEDGATETVKETNDDFKNLESDTEYQTHPIVKSPLLDEPLEMLSKISSFTTTSGSLREQLIKMYHETDGEHWEDNTNWCSDKPIEEWTGIVKVDGKDGKTMYIIALTGNRLRGIVNLSDSTLIEIYLDRNELSEINVSGCVNLESLSAEDQPLKVLRVANCKKLELTQHDYPRGLEVLDISDSRALADIQWDSPAFGEGLKELAIRNREDITSLWFAYYSFKSLELLDCSGCKNLICNRNLQKCINLRYLDISGCDRFDCDFYTQRNLEILKMNNYHGKIPDEVSFEFLKELEARNCSALKSIGIYGSYDLLTTLSVDVTDCTDLESLSIHDKKLTDLKLVGCSNLKKLSCASCQLTTLDLSDVKQTLEEFDCYDNKLTFLDIQGCNRLKDLGCGRNLLQSLDVSAFKELESLGCESMQLSYLNINGCDKIRVLSVGYCGLTSLDLRNCASTLTYLDCNDNQLSSLDLRGCYNLKYLTCDNNQLSQLDLKDCTELEKLHCINNKLTALNLNSYHSLSDIEISNNPFQRLDFSDCPKLNEDCIGKIISVGRSSDAFINLSNNSTIYRIYSRWIDGRASLDLNNCTNLTYVNIRGEGIGKGGFRELNVSGCITLDTLVCSYSELEKLNVDGCQRLSRLECEHSLLRSLDVSSCSSLKYLSCSSNRSMTSINLRNNHVFDEFYCMGTKITMQIPAWLEDKFARRGRGGYQYDQRFWYQSDGEVEDYGYGWWFSGEPDKGRHEPN